MLERFYLASLDEVKAVEPNVTSKFWLELELPPQPPPPPPPKKTAIRRDGYSEPTSPPPLQPLPHVFVRLAIDVSFSGYNNVDKTTYTYSHHISEIIAADKFTAPADTLGTHGEWRQHSKDDHLSDPTCKHLIHIYRSGAAHHHETFLFATRRVLMHALKLLVTNLPQLDTLAQRTWRVVPEAGEWSAVSKSLRSQSTSRYRGYEEHGIFQDCYGLDLSLADMLAAIDG